MSDSNDPNDFRDDDISSNLIIFHITMLGFN